jgi:hypothetical protein
MIFKNGGFSRLLPPAISSRVIREQPDKYTRVLHALRESDKYF